VASPLTSEQPLASRPMVRVEMPVGKQASLLASDVANIAAQALSRMTKQLIVIVLVCAVLAIAPLAFLLVYALMPTH
jgi:hypothetical protein